MADQKLDETPAVDNAAPTLFFYECGNCLRGYFGGHFSSDDEAWTDLSDKFNTAFPSHSGRSIELRKTIRHGSTAGGNAEPDHFYAKLKEEAAEQGVKVSKLSPVLTKTAPR